MDAITSMKRKLSPLGIFNLEDSLIEDELMVYAVELDRLREESDRILREGFLSTALEEGLSLREKMYGNSREDLPAQTRREMIEKRFSLGPEDFTLDGIKKALDSFNLTYTLTEYPPLFKVNVIASGDYSQAQERWIEQEAQKVVPSHLEFQLVFNTMSWDQLDAMNKTFSALDNENLSWDQLDRRKATSS